MAPKTASLPGASRITRSDPEEPAITIDRCVCRQTLFADLLPLARARGWQLAELSAATGCGAQCGLCRPYLAAMLRDGVTVFHRVLPPLPPVLS